MAEEISRNKPETLGGDISNFLADTLVGIKIEGELGVVLLDDELSTFLHGLGSNATLKYC